MKLIIVESPGKINTIKKYAGKGYDVKASVGHIKDLPPKDLGIDTKNNFKTTFIVNEDKQNVVADLKKAAKDADEILLATDPDREGECIAKHLSEELKVFGKCRITFNEITESAIKEALKNPREINQNKVNAQIARRVLDRLLGFKVSPTLWRKVAPKTSAGRVQSAALLLISQKEREIRRFKSEKYWTVHAELTVDGHAITAQVVDKNGKHIEFASQIEAETALESINSNPIEFVDTDIKMTSRSPYAPFTTSTLQQTCASFYSLSATQTMLAAQKLYEGIVAGSHGEVALITYMRTDSTRSAPEAITSARNYITENHAREYLPANAKTYDDKKSKNKQDAHEAIRPTHIDISSSCISDTNQKNVYDLIWKRFVASQMTEAQIEQTKIKFKANEVLLEARGSRIAFDGFLSVYPIKIEEQTLPQLSKIKKITLAKADNIEHTTQPPKRYSEASLIKTLEKEGIGRPSTYATIVKTIIDRKYATKDKGSFHLTELGLLVNDELQRNFTDLISLKFTSQMEDFLDEVEEGKSWKTVISKFYDELKADLKLSRTAEKKPILTSINCPKCEKPMLIRFGLDNRFMGCSGYPECKNTLVLPDSVNLLENIDTYNSKNIEICLESIAAATTPCPDCQAPLKRRKSRFGEFWGCTAYPECKYTKNIAQPIIKCPDCETGDIIEKTKEKNKFYACTGYPNCKKIYPCKPTDERCNLCQQNLVISKTKNVCCNKDCNLFVDVYSLAKFKYRKKKGNNG